MLGPDVIQISEVFRLFEDLHKLYSFEHPQFENLKCCEMLTVFQIWEHFRFPIFRCSTLNIFHFGLRKEIYTATFSEPTEAIWFSVHLSARAESDEGQGSWPAGGTPTVGPCHTPFPTDQTWRNVCLLSCSISLDIMNCDLKNQLEESPAHSYPWSSHQPGTLSPLTCPHCVLFPVHWTRVSIPTGSAWSTLQPAHRWMWPPGMGKGVGT